MKQVSHRGYLLVEVPEGAKDILLTNAHVDNDLVYPNQYGTFNHIAMIPEGQWEIIGKASEVSEELFDEIIGKDYVVSGKRECILILKLKTNE